MKNLKLSTIIILLMFTVCSVFAKGKQESGEETTSAAAIDRENQAAIVNGEGISMEELEKEVALVSGQMASSGQPVPADRKEEFTMQVLDSMISRQLLLDKARELAIGLTEEEVDARLEEIKTQFPSAEEFETALAGQGLTEERLRKDLKDNLVIQELLEQEVEGKIVVSDADARSFYDDNPQQFRQPEQIQASHIILTLEEGTGDAEKSDKKKQLEDLKARIEGGEDFAELAREHSQGPSAPRGGDLGFFSRGQMVKPFEDAAFALDVGELSGIVETQFGYHLITVTDKKAASTVAYEEIVRQIKEYIKQQKTSGEFDRYLQELRDSAEIEVLLDSGVS